MVKTNIKLGKNIQKAMIDQSVSMELMAKILRISKGTLYGKIKGKPEFKASEIIKISNLLGIKINKLFGEKDGE